VIQLVYLSDRAPTLDDATIVDQIVLPAMRFNASADLTGCLWFGRGHFLQVIEGPEEAVRDLYARIQKDPRHHNVRLLLFSEITERAFSRFAMKYIEGGSSAETMEIDRLIARFAPSVPTVSGEPLANPRAAGASATLAIQTIVVAVRKLAFWRPREGEAGGK